jgi:formate/nitrite transporter
VATAFLVVLSGQYLDGGGSVGRAALEVAAVKAERPFWPALYLGILCNVLVCLAVWLALGARGTADKILAILFPISAFVAAGVEHSVANMYLLPVGLFIEALAPAWFWTDIGARVEHIDALTWARFAQGLVPVTIGNVIGGGVLVGAVYWFVYLRGRKE